jgi:hypothetical protein
MNPSLVFAIAIASLYGFMFYLIFGHGWWRLVFYWLVAVAGFFLGQWIANLVGLAIFNVGEVKLVEGTLTSMLGLITVRAWRG